MAHISVADPREPPQHRSRPQATLSGSRHHIPFANISRLGTCWSKKKEPLRGRKKGSSWPSMVSHTTTPATHWILRWHFSWPSVGYAATRGEAQAFARW